MPPPQFREVGPGICAIISSPRDSQAPQGFRTTSLNVLGEEDVGEGTPRRLGIPSWSEWKQFTLTLSQIQEIWGKWFPHFSSINQRGCSWPALSLRGGQLWVSKGLTSSSPKFVLPFADAILSLSASHMIILADKLHAWRKQDIFLKVIIVLKFSGKRPSFGVRFLNQIS